MYTYIVDRESTIKVKEGKTMKKQTIAIATKGYKKVELKSWEQVMAYQNRGWKITMAK